MGRNPGHSVNRELGSSGGLESKDLGPIFQLLLLKQGPEGQYHEQPISQTFLTCQMLLMVLFVFTCCEALAHSSYTHRDYLKDKPTFHGCRHISSSVQFYRFWSSWSAHPHMQPCSTIKSLNTDTSVGAHQIKWKSNIGAN